MVEKVNDVNNNILRIFIFNKYKTGYFLAVILVFILLVLFSLPLIFPKISKKIFNGFQVFAIPYESEIVNGRVFKDILWLDEVEFEDIRNDQLIGVDIDDTVWIVKVYDKDIVNQELLISTDGVILNRISSENIVGSYLRESKFFGVIYFFTSQPLSLLLIAIAFIASLVVAYLGFIKNIYKFKRKYLENYLYE